MRETGAHPGNKGGRLAALASHAGSRQANGTRWRSLLLAGCGRSRIAVDFVGASVSLNSLLSARGVDVPSSPLLKSILLFP